MQQSFVVGADETSFAPSGSPVAYGGFPSVGNCEPEGHRVRDRTLARCDFVRLVQDIRLHIKATLLEAADYEIGAKEKTPLAKTVRTCRQLLKVESAMWLFVTIERLKRWTIGQSFVVLLTGHLRRATKNGKRSLAK